MNCVKFLSADIRCSEQNITPYLNFIKLTHSETVFSAMRTLEEWPIRLCMMLHSLIG